MEVPRGGIWPFKDEMLVDLVGWEGGRVTVPERKRRDGSNQWEELEMRARF